MLFFALLLTEEMYNSAKSACNSSLIPSQVNPDLCSRYSLLRRLVGPVDVSFGCEQFKCDFLEKYLQKRNLNLKSFAPLNSSEQFISHFNIYHPAASGNPSCLEPLTSITLPCYVTDSIVDFFWTQWPILH